MKEIKPEDMAKEIGQRCRRVRMAKGLSQPALAELAGTTAQNISKYEKSGISDIFWIKKLSDILNTNLQEDEIDQEGVVGEIGKEILYNLSLDCGYMSVVNIINSKILYGIGADRISHEIFKLEKIGMVVREQYTDWYGETEDTLFITAKGIITLKNMQLNDNMSGLFYRMLELDMILSYEQIIGDYNNYQELIDDRPYEKIIRNIQYVGKDDFENYGLQYEGFLCTDYRMNYVMYLKENFESGLETDEVEYDWSLVPRDNIYSDIIYRMAMGITSLDKWIDDFIDLDYFMNIDDSYKKEDMYDERQKFNGDFVVFEALGALNKKLNLNLDPFAFEEGEFVIPDSDPSPVFTKNDVEDFLKNMQSYCRRVSNQFIQRLYEDEELQKRAKEFNNMNHLNKEKAKEIYLRNAEKHSSKYPTEWFSKEEIEEYIKTYMGPAKTEAEKALDRELALVNELCPKTLEYYRFPKEWEENGLADLVRKNYNIPKLGEV